MRFWNSGIAAEAHSVLGGLAHAPAAFALDNSGWWICVDAGGGVHKASSNDLSDHVESQIASGRAIETIAISPNGSAWAVYTDDGQAAAVGLEGGAQSAIHTGIGDPNRRIAINDIGGVAVLTATEFEARGIDDECFQTILNVRQHGPVDVVQFAAGGGWIVIGYDTIVARHLDQALIDKIASFIDDGDAISTVAIANGSSSWSVISNEALTASDPIPLRVAEQDVAGEPIRDTMNAAGTPGVSIAVVEGSDITSTAGYGWLSVDHPFAVHPESVFQAASISKLVNALGVLRLSDDGAFKLNDDVRPFLNWELGQRFVGEVPRVSFRQLLRHSGGVIGAGTTTLLPALGGPTGNIIRPAIYTDDGGGFAGYRSDVALPDIVEILDGQPVAANSPTIELSHEPNSRYSYSGAGSMLLHRAIEQITGQDYAAWMNDNVLEPLGMHGSTFDIGPPSGFVDSDQIAEGHWLPKSDDGIAQPAEVIAGARRNYPESAAAGLYTNALDLCRVIMMINAGGDIDGVAFLSSKLIDQMLKPSPHPSGDMAVGLGCFLPQRSIGQCWSHGGSNAGFQCKVFGVPAENAGIVVMTNGSSNDFMNDVVNAALAAHGW